MPVPPNPGPPVAGPLLNTHETAALLRCSPATLEVDRCRRRWKVPFLRVGRSIRYDQSAVLAWLASRNPAEMVGGVA